MKRVRRIWGVVAGAGALGASPLLVSLATFVSLPIILRTLGSQAWLSIAVGQVVAEIGRVIVIWGWNAIGLTLGAALDEPGRVRYYFDSIPPRLLLLIPSVIGSVLVCYLVPTHSHLAAALTAVGGSLYGLSAAWVFIGGREPRNYLLFDSLPRAAATLIGALALFVVPDATVFGLWTIVGSLVAVFVPYVLLRRRALSLGVDSSFAPWSRTTELLRSGFPAFITGIVLVARMSTAVLLTPIVAPAAAPAVALGDKFLRWSNTGMTPLIQALQVRISGGDVSLATKVRRGLIAAWATGPLIGIAVLVLVLLASDPLSDGEIPLGLDVAAPIGVVIALVFIAALTGNSVLVLLGRIGQVMTGAVVALILLLTVFVPLTRSLGAGGAFTAFAIAECFVTAYQLYLVRSSQTGGDSRRARRDI